MLYSFDYIFVFCRNVSSGESFISKKVAICLNPSVRSDLDDLLFLFSCLRFNQT